MTVANTLRGDVSALEMDSNDRTENSSKSIALAYAFLYFIHMITYIVARTRKVKTSQFIDLERKIYIPILACAASYLIHSFSWWSGVMIWFVVVFWAFACICCMVQSLRKGIAFKIAITLALLVCLIYWGVYYVLFVWWRE